MARLITPSQYAKLRGVSPAAVTKAMKAERITTVEHNGKRMIDPEVADIQWAKNTRPRVGDLQQSAPVAELDRPLSPPEAEVHDIKRARAKREHHEANLAEMRERKESGQLVELSRVKKAAVDAGALLRTALEQIAGKVGSLVAAESDAAECRRIINREMDAALEDAASNLQALGHVGE
jgi:hypothetical protein